jgi:hypothetical protein
MFFTRPKSTLPESVGSRWLGFSGNQAGPEHFPTKWKPASRTIVTVRAWYGVATFVVLIAAVRHFADDEPRDNSLIA